tara:strand:+ start:3017 stop:3724 length:708 start_codon:yes stop_codon:yes gene_type:complete
MDTASVNSFIPTLDQIDSWSEILTLLPILVSLEILLSADNAVALASLTKSLRDSQDRTKALNIGITISLIFRILLILLSSFLLKYLFIRIFAGLYLIYLFFSNIINKNNNNKKLKTDNLTTKDNKFDFFKVVALLSVTDLAFSIDSITTAVAISDQYILIIIGALIGVIALRFTSEIFLRLIEYFVRLEMAGYIAILIIGIKLILNTLVEDIFLPDYYFYILIFSSFVWGFSKKE